MVSRFVWVVGIVMKFGNVLIWVSYVCMCGYGLSDILFFGVCVMYVYVVMFVIVGCVLVVNGLLVSL